MQRGKLFVKWAGKAFCAGVLSLGLLILFGCIYYSGGATYSGNGVTDYAWKPNGWFVYGNSEGYSWGRYDKNGYNNSYDSKTEQIDVVLMGSSHVEGHNVNPTQNMAYQLNVLMNEIHSDFYAYNVGLSGYQTARCITNLENVCRTFSPQQAVLIEVLPLDFSVEEMRMAVNGTLPPMMPEQNEIKRKIIDIPYLQLLASRVKEGVKALHQDQVEEADTAPQEWAPEEYSSALDSLLKQAIQITSKYGCNLVLFYHPHLLIQENGSVVPDHDPAQLALFKGICEKNKVTFLDMTEPFIEAYETDHILPHGFANTAVGVGHLNRCGHKMIAEELAKVLETMEINAHEVNES